MTFPTRVLVGLAMLLPVVARRSGSVLRAISGSRAGSSSSFLNLARGGDSKAHHVHETPFGITGGDPTVARKSFRVVQVHVVHRHGDRTPITPLKNEEYWASSLPQPDVLQKIGENTRLIRDEESKANDHAAGGKGAFGKLTQAGLFQMVELGNKLREELHSDVADDHHVDDEGNQYFNKGRLFHPEDPLHPRHVKVVSTDFPRTIQSVQGLLVGLFPDGVPEEHGEPIDIDVRHTNVMIPDPQPRQTTEQVELETLLADRPHLKEREETMKELAVRATDALRDSLGEGAYDVSYGIGEEKESNSALSEPLSWSQLCEVTKCLQIRGLLPATISDEDQEAISSYAAWRWFENLRHPRMAYLAMNSLVSRMVDSMHRKRGESQDNEHVLHIYSAHDSTLIALICAYRLEQPSQWPEYGSYLKVELVEVRNNADADVEHFVRFSLNGKVLRSYWEVTENGEPVELVPLDRLSGVIDFDGANT